MMRGCKVWAGVGLTGLLVYGHALQAAADLFAPTQERALGWRESAWFGFYHPAMFPWVYHLQHGWIYVEPWGETVWFWDTGTAGWMAVNSLSYPLIYSAADRAWFYYYRDTHGPRWFADWSDGVVFQDYAGVLLERSLISLHELGLQLNHLPVDGTAEAMGELFGLLVYALSAPADPLACPFIQRDPEPAVDLSNPPVHIGLALQFGDEGCAMRPGGATYAGFVDLKLSELEFSPTGVSLGLVLSTAGLIRDGRELLNGAMAGHFSTRVAVADGQVSETHWVTETRTTTDLAAICNNLTWLGLTLDGQLELSLTEVLREIESKIDWSDFRTEREQHLTLELAGLRLQTLEIASGQLVLATHVDGRLTLDGWLESAGGSRMEWTELTWDPAVCAQSPVGGELLLLAGGRSYRQVFDGNCDGVAELLRRW